jgi:hypothetical protein
MGNMMLSVTRRAPTIAVAAVAGGGAAVLACGAGSGTEG